MGIDFKGNKMNDIPEKRLKKFFAIAWERHRIYTLKAMGMPKPWTDDPIFQQYCFCNVFRRIDKTTEYFVDLIINKNESYSDLWKSIILFRYISRISTYKELEGHEFDFSWMYKRLREMQRNKDKIFTNAFIVNSKTSIGWSDKVTYIFKLLKYFEEEYPHNMFDTTLRHMGSISSTYTAMLSAPGIGPFMAYQYCMDFTYSSRYLLHAKDAYTWTSLGLGAVRGMNRLLYGRAMSNKILFDVKIAGHIFNEWLNEVYYHIEEEIDKTYGVAFVLPDITRETIAKHYKWFRKLAMCDVEHWLCEYDKYCRGGSKKRRYSGI